MKYFDFENNRLVFEEQEATAHFWDSLWNDPNLKKSIENGKNDWFVSRLTKKFIPPKKSRKILEGGCGKGTYVYSLTHSGYDAYGVDYAPKTVAKINEIFPELKISYGDVMRLDFPDDFFDGYWSLGVIEHFYDGYGKIIEEMRRVIKKDGFLFLTFPCLSPIRKIKAKLGRYNAFKETAFKKNNFYQFALDPRKVRSDLEKIGFKLIKQKPLDGVKGIKDEIPSLKPAFQKIYNSKTLPAKSCCLALSQLLAPIFHHSILLIFKKND
jgi:SAM-dependent methyltransferase